MARVDNLDGAVGELGLDRVQPLGEDRARVERVERDHRVERDRKLARVAAHHRGQMGQDPAFLGFDFSLQHHQAVVQLDRPHRLDK